MQVGELRERLNPSKHLDSEVRKELHNIDDQISYNSEETKAVPGLETVDELRERLERMKLLMAEKSAFNSKQKKKKAGNDVIDGNFLSVMFAVTLLIIIGVSVYAFYNLFWAIWKRNSRYHEEL
ncbi:uncharacterized protein LOC126748533 [Anthonomus grandis grandis]|uniref:uncharacterized protein LOC126748533 n=1 Tax=Anthonomus grandis grandis TaxID=2921223 RepID=UPI0021659E23|nr:uncharacterized protein LOC126748533 [Anthonomus grandis grandis]